MDVNENLRQMATTKPLPTAPGMPKRGTYITDPADGARVLVTRSIQMPGKVIAYCLDDNSDVREVEL